MRYKQIQIKFYEENPNLEQVVYDFFESKNFKLLVGSYSIFQSKGPMSVEDANNTLAEFLNEFSYLANDIEKFAVVETGKPRSLKFLFK